MPKLVMEYSREELSRLQLGVVVEAYSKVLYSGSKRRKYLKEFSEKERKAISGWYTLAYKWYLKTGYPERFIFRSIKSRELVTRMTNFFAQI